MKGGKPRRDDLFVHILHSTIFEEGRCGRFESWMDYCSKSTERSFSVGGDGTSRPPLSKAVNVSVDLFDSLTYPTQKKTGTLRVKANIFPGFT